VQDERPRSKVDLRRLALRDQKMAASNDIASNPLEQAANPEGGLPDGGPGVISGGERHRPVWDSHIINATFPPV
jgi:hypothetical protein